LDNPLTPLAVTPNAFHVNTMHYTRLPITAVLFFIDDMGQHKKLENMPPTVVTGLSVVELTELITPVQDKRLCVTKGSPIITGYLKTTLNKL
jgi:hypothetical protein